MYKQKLKFLLITIRQKFFKVCFKKMLKIQFYSGPGYFLQSEISIGQKRYIRFQFQN